MTDVQATGHSGEVAMRPHEQFMQYLAQRAVHESQNRGFKVAASQMDKILTAMANGAPEEDVWEADNLGTINGADAQGMELQINAMSFAPSADEFDAPLGVYVLVEGQRLDTGEEVLVNTGSTLVITKLYAWEQMGKIPGLCCKIEGTKIAGGNTVLKLRPIPARAVRVQPE